MELSDLKAGKRIYDTSESSVKWYTYLCVHPTGKGLYHILINSVEEPFRIWHEHLKAILDKDLKSYQEAELYLAEYLEAKAKRLREKLENPS